MLSIYIKGGFVLDKGYPNVDSWRYWNSSSMFQLPYDRDSGQGLPPSELEVALDF